MVRDGIYYGLAFIIIAALVAWLTLPALGLVLRLDNDYWRRR